MLFSTALPRHPCLQDLKKEQAVLEKDEDARKMWTRNMTNHEGGQAWEPAQNINNLDWFPPHWSNMLERRNANVEEE